MITLPDHPANLMRRALSSASALLRDAPRYRRALRSAEPAYLSLRNRGEHIEPAPHGPGYRCDWRWTSELRAPQLLPSIGQDLMARALSEAPIRFADQPLGADPADPQVTFLIGHRGVARLPLLLTTLRTVAAQSATRVECIVVEQDAAPTLQGRLPPWVRYLHAPSAPNAPYCRSETFNLGRRYARAPVLVLHDNDMLVPHTYSQDVLARVQQGYEAVNVKRFVFYMAQVESTTIITQLRCDGLQPATIVQNLEAGGSVAITAAAYDRIGGMDEGFKGWGGEDNEFWERANTLNVWPWAHLPIVHLWHAPQPNKGNPNHEPLQRYRELSRIDPVERIDRLRKKRTTPAGHLQAP